MGDWVLLQGHSTTVTATMGGEGFTVNGLAVLALNYLEVWLCPVFFFFCVSNMKLGICV